MTSWTPALDPALPRYLAIAQAIEKDAESGRLSPGAKLPTHRDLAWQLGVTVGTVTRAYRVAERRGVVSGEVGRGSFVRSPGMGPDSPTTAGESGPLDLQGAVPPRVHRKQDLDEALEDLKSDLGSLDYLNYPPAAGYPEHRDMAQIWLRQSGVDVATNQVVLTAGAQHGLIATLATIAQPGQTLLVEPLTYPTVQPIARQLGLKLEALAADDQGVIPESLAEAVRSGPGRIAYFVPTLHNPTSVVLSPERRAALAEIASRHDLTLIEDDIFRLLLRDAPATIQSLAPERTWYLSSLSKTVAAGLRIGFVAAPPQRAEGLMRTMFSTGGRAVGFTAHIANHWITTGTAGRILNDIRAESARRREAALQALAGMPLRCEPGSMFAWVSLPASWRPMEFVSAALASGIKLTPGDAFATVRGVDCNGIRVCFGGAPSLARLVEGCEKLKRLATEDPAASYQAMA